MGWVFFPGQEGILCVQKMVRNYRRSVSRDTILCVTNGCQLRGRSPSVRWLLRLEGHANLDWTRRVCVYFAVGITAAVIKWEFMDSRQADQASAEPRGTPTRGSMSVGRARPRGTELRYVRASCACLPTPLKYRSGQGVSSAETAGPEAWWRWHGRNVRPVCVTCVLVLTRGGYP